MRGEVELPKAFSVRDEQEFYPFQHLIARLNPKLIVKQVATGKHVNGGYTVFWGVVYLEGHEPGREDVQRALKDAGFDFAHSNLNQVFEWSDTSSTEKTHI